MREYPLPQLGYFTESECRTLKEALDGTTFMRFNVTWSNMAGNCTLIIRTDYDETPENIVNFFLGFALSYLAGLIIRKEK